VEDTEALRWLIDAIILTPNDGELGIEPRAAVMGGASG